MPHMNNNLEYSQYSQIFFEYFWIFLNTLEYIVTFCNILEYSRIKWNNNDLEYSIISWSILEYSIIFQSIPKYSRISPLESCSRAVSFSINHTCNMKMKSIIQGIRWCAPPLTDLQLSPCRIYHFWIKKGCFQQGLNPKKTDISRDYSAMRKALAATLYDFFLSSFPHILTPNLWRPGVRFWSYVTFCTCTSDRKWLQNVILCTKSMQIEFFHIVHVNMLIFTLNGWNEFVLALLCFKKCLSEISPKKTTKTKEKKQRNT